MVIWPITGMVSYCIETKVWVPLWMLWALLFWSFNLLVSCSSFMQIWVLVLEFQPVRILYLFYANLSAPTLTRVYIFSCSSSYFLPKRKWIRWSWIVLYSILFYSLSLLFLISGMENHNYNCHLSLRCLLTSIKPTFCCMVS